MTVINYQQIVKSCQVRCMCGRIHRVTAAQRTSCDCGMKLSIETPYKSPWFHYIPWAEMPDNVPDGYTPHGYRTIYPFVAVVGQ